MALEQVWEPINPQNKKIAVFPPPRYTPDFAAKADAAIRELGFNPYIPSQAARATHDYHTWQGSPEERAADIMEVLRNPEIGVIFSFGGSGSTEVVQVLKHQYRDEIHAMAKEVVAGKRAAPPLFGFSDATNLQHFLGQKGVVSPVHFSTELIKVNGSNLPEEKDMTPADIADFQAIQKGMMQFLKEPVTESVQLRPVNHAATVPAQIKGGLTVYGKHDIHTDVGAVMGGAHSNILLLEAGQEGRNFTNGLREKLSTLKAYGKLGGLEAIIISQCDANGNAKQAVETADISALEQVVREEIGDSIPVLFGAPFGHPIRNALLHSRPVPLYTDTTLSLSGEGATLDINPARSTESVREVAAQFATMPNPSRQNIQSVTPQEQIAVNTDITRMAFTPLRSNQPLSNIADQETLICAMDMSGAMVRGAELTALKGKDLTGKNIVIHMPLPELPPDFAPDFWEKLPQEQKDGWYCSSLQLAMTELVQSESLQGINSLTISANEPLPEPSKQWLDDFSRTHFPQASVFTTHVPVAVSNYFPDQELALLHREPRGLYPVNTMDTAIFPEVETAFCRTVGDMLNEKRFLALSDCVHGDNGIRYLHSTDQFFTTLEQQNVSSLILEGYPAVFQERLDQAVQLVRQFQNGERTLETIHSITVPATKTHPAHHDLPLEQPTTNLHQEIISLLGNTRLWGHEYTPEDQAVGSILFADMIINATSHDVKIIGGEVRHSPEVMAKYLPEHLQAVHMTEQKILFGDEQVAPFPVPTEAERQHWNTHKKELGEWTAKFRMSSAFHDEVASLVHSNTPEDKKAVVIFGSGHMHGGSRHDAYGELKRNESLPYMLGREQTATLFLDSAQRSPYDLNAAIKQHFPDIPLAESQKRYPQLPEDVRARDQTAIAHINRHNDEAYLLLEQQPPTADYDPPDIIFDMRSGNPSRTNGSLQEFRDILLSARNLAPVATERSSEAAGDGAPPPPGHSSWAAMTRSQAAGRGTGSPPPPG